MSVFGCFLIYVNKLLHIRCLLLFFETPKQELGLWSEHDGI
jgi:hypothetical protein